MSTDTKFGRDELFCPLRMAVSSPCKLMQARLIRVVGLRVAEPLVLYNYEGGAECESNKYRQDYISQID